MEKESRNKKIVRMSSRKQTTGKTNTKKKRHGAKSRNKCEKLKWNFHNALLFIVQIENKILTQFFFNYLKCGSVIVKGLQSCLNTLSFFFLLHLLSSFNSTQRYFVFLFHSLASCILCNNFRCFYIGLYRKCSYTHVIIGSFQKLSFKLCAVSNETNPSENPFLHSLLQLLTVYSITRKG